MANPVDTGPRHRRRWFAAFAACGFAGGSIAGENAGDPFVFWIAVATAAVIVLGIALGSFGDGR